MTEQEWLNCTELDPVLKLRGFAEGMARSYRKKYLYPIFPRRRDPPGRLSPCATFFDAPGEVRSVRPTEVGPTGRR
jgi:hypothetical protein